MTLYQRALLFVFAALMFGVAFGGNYLLAQAGHPSSVWLMNLLGVDL